MPYKAQMRSGMEPEPCYYFDPLDQLANEDHDGLALHLCIDYDMLETLPVTLLLVSWLPSLHVSCLATARGWIPLPLQLVLPLTCAALKLYSPTLAGALCRSSARPWSRLHSLPPPSNNGPSSAMFKAGFPFSTGPVSMRQLLLTLCSHPILVLGG